MKKNLVVLAGTLCILQACNQHVNPLEPNYTVPSWTLYQRALILGQSIDQAKKILVGKDYPYNINTTIHGNPSTQMGITWFTNATVPGGVVQIVEGKVDKPAAFSKARAIPAATVALDTLNYVSIGRGDRNNNDELMAATGFAAGEKRSYMSNKALIDELRPNTTYSFRVGKKGAWSPIGRFTTASADKEAFEFIYITDTQANTDDNFDISKTTVETAYQHVPNAKFLLMCGDHIESAGAQSSEWEWEQWFEKMQHIWLHLPIAPTQGNHDTSPFNNLYHHFNIETTFDNTIYAFPYGDALFMVISYEGYRRGESYFVDLERWMRQQIAQHIDRKWKIVSFHKTMFTGAGHQNDADGKIVRERMAPVFKELGIDLTIQGHDHVYEVIGAMTPKEEGVYDVSEEVLYFLNNSAGKKKYYPRSKEQMEADYHQHGVRDYFDLFHKLEQTGEPTFSHVTVSTAAIEVATYTVSDTGKTAVLDAFRVVKH